MKGRKIIFNITKEFLENQYLKLGKSGHQIAKELGIPKYHIHNNLVRYKIPTRPLLLARRPRGSSGKKGYKWCSLCKQDKLYAEFSKNHRARLGLDAHCKSCVSPLHKKYIIKNKEKRQKLKAKIVLEFGNKCKNCSTENLPICAYVFHHHSERMNNKNYITPRKFWSNQSLPLAEEKKKWILLCANCHSIVHGGKLTVKYIMAKY